MNGYTVDELITEIQSNEKVFVDFYSDFCSPCKAMMPTIDELVKDHSDIKFIKVNTMESEDAAFHFGVLSIPSFKFYKNGIVVSELNGIQTKDSIIKMFN